MFTADGHTVMPHERQRAKTRTRHQSADNSNFQQSKTVLSFITKTNFLIDNRHKKRK